MISHSGPEGITISQNFFIRFHYFTGLKRKNNSENDNGDDIWAPEKSKIPKMKSVTTNLRAELSDKTNVINNAIQNELSKEDSELFKTLFGFPNSLDGLFEQNLCHKCHIYGVCLQIWYEHLTCDN